MKFSNDSIYEKDSSEFYSKGDLFYRNVYFLYAELSKNCWDRALYINAFIQSAPKGYKLNHKWDEIKVNGLKKVDFSFLLEFYTSKEI